MSSVAWPQGRPSQRCAYVHFSAPLLALAGVKFWTGYDASSYVPFTIYYAVAVFDLLVGVTVILGRLLPVAESLLPDLSERVRRVRRPIPALLSPPRGYRHSSPLSRRTCAATFSPRL